MSYTSQESLDEHQMSSSSISNIFNNGSIQAEPPSSSTLQASQQQGGRHQYSTVALRDLQIPQTNWQITMDQIYGTGGTFDETTQTPHDSMEHVRERATAGILRRAERAIQEADAALSQADTVLDNNNNRRRSIFSSSSSSSSSDNLQQAASNNRRSIISLMRRMAERNNIATNTNTNNIATTRRTSAERRQAEASRLNAMIEHLSETPNRASSNSFDVLTAALRDQLANATTATATAAASFNEDRQREIQNLQQMQQQIRSMNTTIPDNHATTSRTRQINNALKTKIVYMLSCAYCKTEVCTRAMRAILLADTKVELYSTDIPPPSLQTLNEDRLTQGCNCRIRDTLCSCCGNVLGYHVSQPCERCLDAKNNGHFWMFYAETITASERRDPLCNGGGVGGVGGGDKPLYWGSLCPMRDDVIISSVTNQLVETNMHERRNHETYCR